MHVIATLDRDYVSGRLPAEIWEITAEEWRNWKKQMAFARASGEQTG